MYNEMLLWIYMANAIILINHEIDSAYWHEWKLISNSDKGGINGFILLHFPMFFIVLYGLLLINNQNYIGLSSIFIICGKEGKNSIHSSPNH